MKKLSHSQWLLKRLLVTGALYLCTTGLAWATVTCSAVASLTPASYAATAATTMTGSVAVTCTRSSLLEPTNLSGNGYTAGTPASVAYNIGADGGNVGTTIALSGSNQLDYDLMRPPSFSTDWSTGNVTAGVVYFGTSSLTSDTNTTNFQMQIPAGRWTSPAGNYTELVTVSINHGIQTELTTFMTDVQVSAACTFPLAPGDVNFGTYNALATGAAKTAFTGFQVLCTQGVPVNIAFDSASGSLLGLTYGLSLSPVSGVVSSGTAANYSINGSMPAGQAGTCSTQVCVGSESRSITLTY